MQAEYNIDENFVAKLAGQAEGHRKFHREQAEKEKQKRRVRAPICGTD